MRRFRVVLTDEAATTRLASKLARFAQPGWVVFLEGELAAGKTFFARAFLRALGHQGAVKSPTFTVLEPYETPMGPVHHFDLYRIEDPEELHYLGFDDSLASRAICLIEWPSKAREALPLPELVISLENIDENVRNCILDVHCPVLQKALEEEPEFVAQSGS